jgi:hypothetical protein
MTREKHLNFINLNSVSMALYIQLILYFFVKVKKLLLSKDRDNSQTACNNQSKLIKILMVHSISESVYLPRAFIWTSSFSSRTNDTLSANKQRLQLLPLQQRDCRRHVTRPVRVCHVRQMSNQ